MQKENNITCHAELVSASQTGRSMVEMLGVLAIIGVLSVGGIAGYTMAMNKYKANEVTNAAAQLAILAEAKYATTGTDIASGYDAQKLGYAAADKIGGLAATAITATTSSGAVTVTIDCGGATEEPCRTIGVAIPATGTPAARKIGNATLVLQ